MSRRLLCALVALAASVSLVAAPAGAAQGVRIASPKDGQFLTGKSVAVAVKAAASVRGLQATLNEKRVDGEFRRVGRGTWRATLKAKRLAKGKNYLSIWAKQSGGKWRYGSVRFTVGRHDGSLLKVTGPGRGRTKVAQVRVARRPLRLTATLDGKRMRWPLGLAPLRRETLRLGGDDGLHFGVNHLRVFATAAGGAWDAVDRKVVVTRDRPLVGAGRDRKAIAGRRVQLNGQSSAPAQSTGTLSYSWSIVTEPPGSTATLSAATSPTPILETDQPGEYGVQLMVTEHVLEGLQPAPVATDVMTVSTRDSLPPIGEQIETMVSNGKGGAEADTGIKIGEKTYWMDAPQGKTAQGLLLNRETLEPIMVASFAGEEAETTKFSEEVIAHGSNGLTIISVPNLDGNAPRNAALGLLAADIGAENTVIYPSWRAGWSAVGVDGTKQGGTIGAGENQNLGANGANYAGDVSGYLQWAGGKGFVFVPGARVSFETDAPGAAPNANKMMVGGREFASKPLPACGQGGFQVEVLLAETLAPVGGQTFTTQGCGAAAEAAAQTEMAGYLKGITVKGGGAASEVGAKLVMVQSIGRPYGPLGHAYDQIAAGIEAVGGVGAAFAVNESAIFGLGKSGYALVGQVGETPPRRAEASELWTGDAAKVAGVLKTNQASAYAPELTSPLGRDNYALSTIAYQPPQAWPDSSSPADRAALKYIAEDVLHLERPEEKNACYVPAQPDVRSMYCDGQEIGHWRENAATLEAAPFAPGHGFEKPEWEAVVNELANEEFKTVEAVWALLENTRKVFVASNSSGHIDFEAIAAEIEKSIQPLPKTITTGWWLELIGNLSSTGSYFSNAVDESETLTKAMGVLQGVMFEAASSLFETNGEPLLDAYKVRTQELAKELAKRYEDDVGGIGKVGEILVSDPGKLQAMKSSGLLGFKPGESKELIEAITRGTEMWAYESLMPSAYEAVGLKAGSLNQPLREASSEYLCSVDFRLDTEAYEPFGKATPGAEFAAFGPSRAQGVLIRKGAVLPEPGRTKVRPPLPPESLLAPLVEPQDGTLGYVAPWFWHDVYDFPSGQNRSLTC